MRSLFWLGLLLAGWACDVRADQRFTHPSGLTFTYPESWRVQALEEGLLILPGDAEQRPGQLPKTFIWASAEAVDPGLALDHPEILPFLDDLVAGGIPGARRGSVDYQAGYGEVAYAVADGGRAIQLRFKIDGGLALIMARSTTEPDDARAEFDRAFASFSATLRTDPELIGAWYRSTTSMSDVDYHSSGDSTYVSSSSQKTYRFFPNNRFEHLSSSQVYAQAGGEAGTTSVSSAGDNPADTGTYAVADGVLTLAWDEGDVVECGYSVFLDHEGNPALKLECGNDREFYRPLR